MADITPSIAFHVEDFVAAQSDEWIIEFLSLVIADHLVENERRDRKFERDFRRSWND
jgi:hypothetical protein